MTTPINIQKKLEKISQHWSPKIIAKLNNYHLKLAKIEGEFIWHKHEETDEVFMVIEGELTIYLHDDKVILNEGELFVVPKGIEHKPFAEKECSILLIEPEGTVNTGEIKNDLTAKADVWI